MPFHPGDSHREFQLHGCVSWCYGSGICRLGLYIFSDGESTEPSRSRFQKVVLYNFAVLTLKLLFLYVIVLLSTWEAMYHFSATKDLEQPSRNCYWADASRQDAENSRYTKVGQFQVDGPQIGLLTF